MALKERRFARWARGLSREYYINARRGIRRSGMLIIAFGVAALFVMYMGSPNFLQGTTILGFLYSSLSHLVGISQIDRGGPVPECPTCRIPLTTHKYRCSACTKQYPTQ